jgi:hypothetical protein
MSNLQEYFGALTPAPDRRLQMRASPASLAYVMFGDTNGGIVLNISETGTAVASADLLVVGDYLPGIRIQFPSSRQRIKISGQIVWLAESKKCAGIRFVDLNADARNQISNWIASEKAAREFELSKLLRRDNQPLEISSRKSRRVFSNPSVGDEETAARYVEMFPSESAHARHTISADEIKPQQGPLPAPVRSNTDPGDSMLHSAAKISTGDLAQTFSLPQVQAAPELVAPSASDTPVILDVSGLQVAALVFLFAVIGLIIGIVATKTGSNVLASLGRSRFGKQVPLRSPSPHTQSASGPPFDSAPIVAPTETSSAQTSRPSVDPDSSTGANSAGSSRPPEEKAKEDTRDSEPSVKVPSTDSNSSGALEPKPSADPKERPNGNDFTGLIARNAPLPASAEHAHSAVANGPIRSTPGNRALLTTKPAMAAAAPKPSPPTASLKHAYPAVTVGPRGTAPGNPVAHTAKPAAVEEPKPSVVVGTKQDHPAVAVSPKGPAPGNPASHTAKPVAAAAPKPSVVGAKHDHPAVTAGPKGAAPGNPAPLAAKPATPTASKPSPQPASSKPTNPAVAAGPKGAAPGNPTAHTAKPAAAEAPKPSPPPATPKPTNPAVAAGPKGAAPGNPATATVKPATPAVPNPPPPASSKPTNPAVAAGPKGAAPGNPAPPTTKPATPAVTSPLPPANSEPVHPAVAAGPKAAAPESPAPLTAKPATPALPNQPPSAYLVTVPSTGSKPLKQVFPQKQIAFSSSLTIVTQLSVLISPEPGPAVAHQPARLQAGDLVSYVAPRQPRPADGYKSTETVKVRATIGPQGQVMDVRPVSGPIFLLSSATSAIRQWRYKPTLLNERPVQAQQDVTMEFRLPR